MRRGEIYRVRRPSGDPKRAWCYVVVSRQTLIGSRYSTVVCAPIYTARDGTSTQVEVGPDEGLKHESAVHCDALVSVPKSVLTDRVGALSADGLARLAGALRIALALD